MSAGVAIPPPPPGFVPGPCRCRYCRKTLVLFRDGCCESCWQAREASDAAFRLAPPPATALWAGRHRPVAPWRFVGGFVVRVMHGGRAWDVLVSNGEAQIVFDRTRPDHGMRPWCVDNAIVAAAVEAVR